MAYTNDTYSGSEPSSNVVGTGVRVAAAVAILVSGLVHLQLYFDGYRDFPNDNLGRSFLANAIASVIITGLLVFRRDVIVRLAGAGLLVGTLIAFWISRTDQGIFGFSERGLEPSPQAGLALVLEIVGLALIAATFVPAVGAGDELSPAVALPALAAILIVAIGGGALWAREPATPSEAGPAESSAPTATSSPGTPSTSTPPDTTLPTSTAPATSETSESTPTTERRRRERPRRSTTTAPAAPTTAAPTTAAPTTTPATEAPEPASDVVTISIIDFAFEPDGLEIPVGTTVEWVNEDSFAHTVVANDDSFASENMDSGDTFSFEFTSAGTFDYTCGIHPSMTASITVTG